MTTTTTAKVVLLVVNLIVHTGPSKLGGPYRLVGLPRTALVTSISTGTHASVVLASGKAVAVVFARSTGLLSAAIIALVSFGVVPRTLRVWLIIGVILLVINGLGYRRLLPALFDRERLVTGSKS